MLRKVKLYGPLADFVVKRGGEKTMEADISTPAEAVRFLVANWPDLHGHMVEQSYRVTTGDFDVPEDELHYPAGSDVKIIPVIGGAGGNTGKVILGIILIGVALSNPAFLAGSIGTFGGTPIALTSLVGSAGVYLTLTGVAGMLAPQPKDSEFGQDPKLSYSFGGVQNTSRAGTPVPIVYGEIFTGSVIISAGIDTEQVVA
tara:strand:- start:2347 stop:2949 length:603 start_codon:yes stop_codon:yes gene_type:complete